MNEVYPYEMDDSYDEWSFSFFNIPGAPSFGIEVADVIAKHVRSLGFGGPGTAHPSLIKYDALGTSGGPWEPGRWIKMDEDRMFVQATVPDKDISDYTDEDIAEAEAALRALKAAKRADAVRRDGGVGDGG